MNTGKFVVSAVAVVLLELCLSCERNDTLWGSDTGFKPVAKITSVSPLSGMAASQVTFTAHGSFYEVDGWTWDFGGGAEPNRSGEEHPYVTLANPGTYACSVTVRKNPAYIYGSVTYKFNLTVTSH